jgi:hypothetical protein
MNHKHDSVLEATPFSLMFNRTEVPFAAFPDEEAREPTDEERAAWDRRLAYARELANPMFAQQIESAKLKVAETVNASRPQAEQLEEGQVVMVKREGMRNKNTSPYHTTPYTAHHTTERHRYELRDKDGKVKSTSVPIERLKVVLSTGNASSMDPEKAWPVEAILDDRRRKVDGVQRHEYKLRWHGWGSEHDSWEPITSICDASLVAKYNADKANRRLRARQAKGAQR